MEKKEEGTNVLVPESEKSKVKVLAAPGSGEAHFLAMRQRLPSHRVEEPAV